MGSVLQSSRGLGALLSSAAYGLLYNYIGRRGLLMLGVLPALLLVYIRTYVKEPAVWFSVACCLLSSRKDRWVFLV